MFLGCWNLCGVSPAGGHRWSNKYAMCWKGLLICPTKHHEKLTCSSTSLQKVYIKSDRICFKDSSSVMEWNQGSGERSQQVLETQQSYETEWDMVNTVSFKKRPCSNTECKCSAFYRPYQEYPLCWIVLEHWNSRIKVSFLLIWTLCFIILRQYRI